MLKKLRLIELSGIITKGKIFHLDIILITFILFKLKRFLYQLVQVVNN